LIKELNYDEMNIIKEKLFLSSHTTQKKRKKNIDSKHQLKSNR